jgi:lysophospholipase L1-like esterase
MKTILAFGDSLTYGADAETGGRHAFEDRWPSVLEKGLNGAARVIAEGLGGRTTTFDDWTSSADLNGARILPVLLKSHQPLDAVVVMLGTNDLKRYVNGSALAAAMGMKRLAEIIRTFPYDVGHPVPNVVLVSPPHPVTTDHADLAPMFDGGMEESKKLAGHYKRVASELGCAFFDASTVAVATPLDGVHLDAANTRKIGEGLLPVVKSILAI